MRLKSETNQQVKHTGGRRHVPARGSDVLDVDGLSANIALLLGVVEIDLGSGLDW